MLWLPTLSVAVIFGVIFLMQFITRHNNEEKLRSELIETRNKLMETEILLRNVQTETIKIKPVPVDIPAPKPETDQLNTSIRESFSMAAHDLRSPVSIIRSAASFIQTSWDKLSPEKIKEFIKIINDESEQMAVLLSKYLDLSKIQTGKLVVEKQLFDLQSLSVEVYNHYKQVAYDKKLYFNFDQTEAGLPKVAGDMIKTREILNNLISNAIKYTYQGGITLKCFQEDNFLSVTIEDSGVGLETQNQTLLFQKFQQVGTSRGQTSAKSSGLGLYLAKKTAKEMGGDLLLESSEPGKGSVFKLKLPIASG